MIELGAGDQSAEVGITLSIFDEQREMVALVHRDLGSDDGPNPQLAGLHDELDDAVKAVVVGERHNRHVQRGRPLEERLGGGGAVEEAVAGVRVEFYVFGHGIREGRVAPMGR